MSRSKRNGTPRKSHGSTNAIWIEIAANEIDSISFDLLHWSGLHALWDANSLDEKYDFYNDVVASCVHVHTAHYDWDNNFPGQSGTAVTVETDNPPALKAEMSTRVKELISRRNTEQR